MWLSGENDLNGSSGGVAVVVAMVIVTCEFAPLYDVFFCKALRREGAGGRTGGGRREDIRGKEDEKWRREGGIGIYKKQNQFMNLCKWRDRKLFPARGPTRCPCDTYFFDMLFILVNNGQVELPQKAFPGPRRGTSRRPCGTEFFQ